VYNPNKLLNTAPPLIIIIIIISSMFLTAALLSERDYAKKSDPVLGRPTRFNGVRASAYLTSAFNVCISQSVSEKGC